MRDIIPAVIATAFCLGVGVLVATRLIVAIRYDRRKGQR